MLLKFWKWSVGEVLEVDCSLSFGSGVLVKFWKYVGKILDMKCW